MTATASAGAAISRVEVAAPDATAAQPELDSEPTGDFRNPPGAPSSEGPIVKPQRGAEVVEARTATSSTYVNSDGSRSLVVSTRPVNFLRDGVWVPVDNRVVRDATRGGLRSAANEWSVWFGPAVSAGIELSTKAGTLTVRPDDGADVTPVLDSSAADGNVVVYPDVWPGVDLRYTVLSNELKEDIVVRVPNGRTDYAFSVAGATVREDPVARSGVSFDGPIGATIGVAPPVVRDRSGRPVSAADPVLEVPEGSRGSKVAVAVDPVWLGSLDASAYPIVIDPVYTTGGAYAEAYKADGFMCNCWLEVGNPVDPWDNYWRTVAYFPYESLWGKQIVLAEIDLGLSQGTSNGHTTNLWEASAWSWYGVGNFITSAYTDTQGILDITAWLQGKVAAQQQYNLMFTGDETPGLYTYKEFAAQLLVVYNTPIGPTTPVAPGVDATNPVPASIVTEQPTLSVNAVTDPDGDPVSYWFRVATSPDGQTGMVWNSGWQSSTSVAVPQGVLKDGQTYWWRAYTGDGRSTGNPAWVWKFRVNKRLGADPTQAYDRVGGASVNLVTGNAVVSVATHTVAAIGGRAGFGLTWNSLAPTDQGLVGSYWQDANQNGAFDDVGPFVRRTDSIVGFNWATSTPPAPGMSGDWWLARWTGYVSVPANANYFFGAVHDDGVRIWVNNTLVLDKWSSLTPPGAPAEYGSSVNLTASGGPYAITVEYIAVTQPAYLDLWVKYTTSGTTEMRVPANWLSTKAAVLPAGWSLDVGGSGGFEFARIGTASVVFVGVAGATVEYTWDESRKAYLPPAGGDGIATRNGDGTVTLQDEGGHISTFNADGTLAASFGPIDDRQPAALRYTYAGSPARLSKVTDPVSAQDVHLYYGGDTTNCPQSPPSGFVVAPAGMLCKIAFWDGTNTKFWYLSASGTQFLGRIENPGGVAEDFGWSNGQLSTVLSPIARDAIADGVRADDATARTEIAYSGGKVSSITAPAPAAGAPRPKHTYDYLSGQSLVHVVGGSEPNGYSNRVDYDGLLRPTTQYDATGKTSSVTWDPNKDLVRASTDKAGMRSTTIYDVLDRPTDSYGPAPAGWFNGDGTPQAAYVNQVPRTRTAYDEGINSLAAVFLPYSPAGKVLSAIGPPAAAFAPVRGTGIGHASGAIDKTWSGTPPAGVPGSDNWGARLSGTIALNQTGAYQFHLTSDDGARLWIDNQLLIDDWNDGGARTRTSSVFTNTTVGIHTIQIDWYNRAGSDAQLKLQWGANPEGQAGVIPGSRFTPAYGLATSVTSYDSTSVAGNPVANGTTTTAYAAPHLGLATTLTADPAGPDPLATAFVYEAPGSGYLRLVGKTLPGGSQTTYAYWGGTETPSSFGNPCGSTGIKQAGRLKQVTEPAPAVGTARVTQFVYDAAGRVLGQRLSTDAVWTCTTYDSRGRPATIAYPAYGAEPARTVTYAHKVNNNPLVTAISDTSGVGSGTVTTTTDLLGRVTASTDVWGKQTTAVYNQAGFLTDTTGPAGAIHTDYDPAGRTTSVTLDGVVVAQPTYDAAGRLDTVTYPAAASSGITFRAATSAANSTSGATTLVINKPAGTQAGDVLVAAVSTSSTSGTVTAPSGWTLVNDNKAGTPENIRSLTYWRVATAGDPGSWTWTFSSSRRASGGIAGYQGVDTTNPVDVAATSIDATSSTNHVAPSVTTTAPNTMLVNVFAVNKSTGYTPPSGSTERLDVANTSASQPVTTELTDAVVAAAGATGTRTAVSGIAGHGRNHSIALRPAPGSGGNGTSLAPVVRDTLGRVTALTWKDPGGITLTTNSVTRSQSGRVVDESFNGADPNGAGTANYRYDSAGRLIWAAVPNHTISYQFAPTAGCGANPAAGKNTNRTSITDNATTHTYCYDNADRLTSTTDPQVGAVAYNSRGDTTTLGAQTLGYDGAGRHTTSTVGTTTVRYQYDPTNALVGRIVTTNGNTIATERYTPGATLDANNNVIERKVSLPSGATITKRATGDVWSYPNVHGHVGATANQTGALIATFTYDPYGQALNGLPDNSDGNFDIGWSGQRGTEHEPGFQPIIAMGARPYHPALGRFLQTDPVDGGSCNLYEYTCGDPINATDYSGTFSIGGIVKVITAPARYVYNTAKTIVSYGAKIVTGAWDYLSDAVGWLYDSVFEPAGNFIGSIIGYGADAAAEVGQAAGNVAAYAAQQAAQTAQLIAQAEAFFEERAGLLESFGRVVEIMNDVPFTSRSFTELVAEFAKPVASFAGGCFAGGAFGSVSVASFVARFTPDPRVVRLGAVAGGAAGCVFGGSAAQFKDNPFWNPWRS